MSVQFILGAAGSGKSEWILQRIKNDLRREEKKKIILLVPEQATFRFEYELSVDEAIGGILSVQVLSFQRLAWQILQKVGGGSKVVISPVGKLMILRKELAALGDELFFLKKAANRPGYMQLLSQSIAEFKRYRLSPEALFGVLEEQLAERSLLSEKLREITTVYDGYCRRFGAESIDHDDMLTLLLEKIPFDDDLKDTVIFIDEFNHFLPQELAIIGALMKKCSGMTIALTLSTAHEHEFLQRRVFRQAVQTLEALKGLALKENVMIEEDILLDHAYRWREAPALEFLANHYFAAAADVFKGDCSSIRLIEGQNITSEVDWAAREIRRLCREEGFHYDEIGILLRQIEPYELALKTTFLDYDIPYFLDQKNTVRHHPLLEVITAALAIVAENFSYQSIFRYLKTDLIPIARHDIDLLENYCLAYGIKGYQWLSDKPWTFQKRYTMEENGIALSEDTLAKINDLRQMVMTPLRNLQDQLKEAQKAEDYVKSLFILLEALLVPETLQKWSMEALETGKNALADIHKQLWEQLMALFDQIVSISADDVLTLADFIAILTTGFDNLDLGLIPTSLDQVFIGSLHRSRSHELKAVFLLGVNEGGFPARLEQEGLFSDFEKAALETMGIKLSPNVRERLHDEEFLIYTALTRSSRYLYISYPLSDSEGKGLKPSAIVRRLQMLLPEIKTQYVQWPPKENETKALTYLEHTSKALGLLGAQLQMDSAENDELWAEVYNYFLQERPQELRRTLAGLFYTHQAKNLAPSLVRQLYRSPIRLSVSSLEKYRQCPFAHFLSYGLRLQEREIYQLASVDVGQFYHKAMERINDYLVEKQLSWRELSDEALHQLTNDVVEELAPQLQNEILLSSSRYHYIKSKLNRTLHRSVQLLALHGRQGLFEAVGVEISFGPHGRLPGLTITLDDGSRLQLSGRIDRIEQATDGNQQYFRVIDFKTGTKGLTLTEIYYGLKIQLLTYLEIALSFYQSLDLQENEILPAGVFYYFFKNPLIKAEQPLEPSAVEAQVMAAMIPKGLAVADLKALLLADQNLAIGSSGLLPIKLKKNAVPYLNGEKPLAELENPLDLFDARSSSVVTPEELALLQTHVKNIIAAAGAAIASGNIAIRPCQLKQFVSCQYCHYQAICQINNTSLQERFLLLKDLSKTEIWQKIREDNQHEQSLDN